MGVAFFSKKQKKRSEENDKKAAKETTKNRCKESNKSQRSRHSDLRSVFWHRHQDASKPHSLKTSNTHRSAIKRGHAAPFRGFRQRQSAENL